MHKLITVTAMALAMVNSATAQTAADDEMRSLTSNVLAGITGKAPEPPEKVEDQTDALRGLVQQALSEGQSDAYLEALISEAADNGQIDVPDAMRTTTGDVDTRTLLASLVAKSEGAESAADVETLETEAQGELEERFYVVTAGDSLAAISLTYYGTTQDYIRIFDANRDRLSRPDLIRVGQTLRIPR